MLFIDIDIDHLILSVPTCRLSVPNVWERSSKRGKLSGAWLFASCHFKVTNMETSSNFVAWDICPHPGVNFQETDRLLGQQYNDDTGYYDTVKVRIAKKFTPSFWLAAIV